MTTYADRQIAEKGNNVFSQFQTYLDEKLGSIRTEVEGIKGNSQLTGEDKASILTMQTELNKLSAEYKALQVGLNAPGNNGNSEEYESKKLVTERKNAINKALARGVGSLSPDERKHVRLDIESGINITGYQPDYGEKAMYQASADTGGFLSTPEMVNDLIKNIVLVSPMPELVSMRYTAKPWVMTPRRTQTATAARVSEQATRTETQNPKFGLVQNFPYESYAFTLVSRTDLDDSELDLGAFLMQEFAEQFGKLQGAEYINGKGQNAGESLGFLNDAVINNGGVGTITTATSGLIDYAALVKLKQSLKPGYLPNATWLWTNETLGTIQTITDTTGRPLWVPFGGTLPELIFGRPYVIMPDMPQTVANGGSSGPLAIAFGDFKRGYEGVVRKQVSMQALYERYADQNAIGYFGYFRFGGTVKLQESIKTLRVKP